MATERVRDTYNKYIPPYMDVEHNVLTFSHVRYHFSSGEQLRTMHARLTAAVNAKDYNEIINIVSSLEPYRIGMKVLPTRKQTVITDV
jgi:hypothetical protein